MTRFERCYHGRLHKCAICDLPVIYDDVEKTVTCKCKVLRDMEFTKNELKAMKACGMTWRELVES